MPVLENQRHELYCQAVAEGKTDEQAMLAAGYAAGTAVRSARMVKLRPEVLARVTELLQARAALGLVTAEKLHRRWSEMFEADIADIIDDHGHYKPIKEWPKVWRQMLAGCDVKELFERSKDGKGAGWDKIGEVVKLKWVGVKELGELLGKHKAVDAFVAQGDQKGGDLHIHFHEEINNRIAAGRLRAAQRNASNRTEVTTLAG